MLLCALAVPACYYDYSARLDTNTAFTQKCLDGDVPHEREVDVATRLELMDAIAAAQPGDLIRLADGIYSIGSQLITIPISGTESAPIYLCGTRNAVLASTGAFPAAITLDNVSYWNFVGFTIHDFWNTIALRQSSHNALRELELYNSSSYVVVVNKASADNLIQDCWLHDSGLVDDQYAGAIVVDYDDSTSTGGCDRTQIIGNHFGPNILSTLVEIQDANVDTLVSENYFDGTGQLAGSWLGINGQRSTVSKNTGVKAVQHGFVVNDGWVGPYDGYDNVFIDNVADVQSTGYGFWISPSTAGNVVYCNNTVRHAEFGKSNVPCQP
jgi:hypothetical protein